MDARRRRLQGGSRRRNAWRATAYCALTIPLAGGCVSWKDKLVKSDIVQSRQLTLEGMDAWDQGQTDDAEGLFAKAVDVCPNDVDARRGYAQSLWRQGKTDEAIEHMHEVARRTGGDTSTLIELGRMYFEIGRHDRAFTLAQQAVLADRQSAEAWELQGRVQLELGRQDDALASLHRAMALQERYPVVQMTVARIYMDKARPHRALATLESLASQYPRETEPGSVLSMRGLVYKSLGRYPEAVDCLAAAVERGERQEETMLQLAEAHAMSGDAANAEAVAVAILDGRPDYAPAQRFLAQLSDRNSRLAALPGEMPTVR